jgi:hypothetical protein
MGEMRNAHNILVGKPEGKNHLGDVGVEESTTLDWILKKWRVKVWTGFILLRVVTTGALLLKL